jgi:hypothetical protein
MDKNISFGELESPAGRCIVGIRDANKTGLPHSMLLISHDCRGDNRILVTFSGWDKSQEDRTR